MAWRTKTGKHSNRGFEEKYRRGTQPKQGIKVRLTVTQQIEASQAERGRWILIREGYFER